jgi:hypothetical protein
MEASTSSILRLLTAFISCIIVYTRNPVMMMTARTITEIFTPDITLIKPYFNTSTYKYDY